MKDSKEIINDFLLYWLKEASSSNPCDSIKSIGLCGNLEYYIHEKYGIRGLFLCEMDLLIFSDRISEVFQARFDGLYPFGGEDRYEDDQHLGIMHLNQMRIDWVKKNLIQPS